MISFLQGLATIDKMSAKMSLNKTDALFHYHNQELFFAGSLLSDLPILKDYSQPLLIYQSALVQKRLDWIQSWKLPHRLHFAIKSNYSLPILKLILKNSCGVDVVSLGEIHQALKAGFKPQDVLFSGVGKTEAELRWAISHQIYQINVESVSELKKIVRLTDALNLNVDIGLRVNPEVDSKTHPYIATALVDSKFGLSMSDLPEVKSILLSAKNVSLKAISYHLGSQIHDVEVMREALQKVKPLYLDWQKKFSSLDRLDLGGGLGIDYHRHSEEQDFQRWEKLKNIYDQELQNFPAFYLLEIGRYLVARSAVLIAEVQYIKKTKNKKFVILDVGMNNLIRPMLYQAYHHIYPLFDRGNLEKYSVVGPICESSDVFHHEIILSELREGDLVAICDAGAYAGSMASNYNLQPIAKDYFLDE
jgi:diaminopimelate decarboxylase